MRTKEELLTLAKRIFLVMTLMTASVYGEELIEFNVPAQPLSSALKVLSEQADIQALYPEEIVANRQSQHLAGRYTTRQALEMLLLDSGLEFDFTDSDTVIVKVNGNPSTARRPSVTNTTSTLPLMVVSATRSEMSIKESPASVSVLTSDDLEKRNAQTLDQAVSIVPGTYSKRLKGFMDSEPRINLRGMPSQARNMIMVDGVPLNNAYNGAANFNSIDMDSIERIEIVRGPFSSLYGGSAMGGVVSVFTKRVDEPFATVKLGYGNAFKEDEAQQNMFDGLISGGLRPFDALGLSLSYRYRSTDGYPTSIVNRTTPPPAGLTGAIQTTDTQGNTRYAIGNTGDNGYWEDIVTIRGDYRFSEISALDFSISDNSSEYDYSAPTTYLRDINGDPVFSSGTAIRESNFLSGIGGIEQTNYAATYTHGWNNVMGKLALGYVKHNPRWFTLPGTTATLDGGPGTLSANEASHWLADWQLEFPLGNQHILTAGVYYSESEAHNQSHNLTNYKDRDSKTDLTHESMGEVSSYALFIQDQYDLSDRITAYTGLRADKWKNSDGMANQVGATGFPIFYEDRTESALSPKAALVYKYTPNTAYRISAGKAFRAPGINELFHTTSGAGGVITAGNPELKPETTVAWEFGVAHTLPNGISIDAAYFNNAMKDFIYRRTVSATLREYQNAGKAHSRGYEFGISGKLIQSINWYANYTHADAKIDENPTLPETEGKYLTLIPKTTWNIGTDWKRDKLSLSGSVHSVDERFSRDDNLDTTHDVYGAYDAYTIAEAKLAYQFNENIGASLAIDNLFDEEYYDFYKAPGRSWFAQVSFTM